MITSVVNPALCQMVCASAILAPIKLGTVARQGVGVAVEEGVAVGVGVGVGLGLGATVAVGVAVGVSVGLGDGPPLTSGCG